MFMKIIAQNSLNKYFSTIVDVCLTIIRNNQFSSRTRTVKDYLSFILALAIGLFRIEEGKLTSRLLP